MVDSWRYSPRSIENEEGAQIDLLFDRNDNVITLCEIKYTNKSFVIDKHMVASLEKKSRILKEQTRTKKQLFWVIISAVGLKSNDHAKNLISGVVTLDDLFTRLWC